MRVDKIQHFPGRSIVAEHFQNISEIIFKHSQNHSETLPQKLSCGIPMILSRAAIDHIEDAATQVVLKKACADVSKVVHTLSTQW